MDDDVTELIRQLCTRAGIIMEDASATAIVIGGLTADELSEVVKVVHQEIIRANSVLAAAAALLGLTA